MLPAGSRLRHRVDFSTTVRRARGVRSGGVLVVHLLTPEASDVAGAPGDPASSMPPRVGFVVARTVGPAVTRNKVKRRLRHLALQHLDDLPLGSTLVLRALPEAGRASYDTLRCALLVGIERSLPRAVSESRSRGMASKDAPR